MEEKRRKERKKKRTFQMVGQYGDKESTQKKKPKSCEPKNSTRFQKDGGRLRTVQERWKMLITE